MGVDFKAVAFWGFASDRLHAPLWNASSDPEPRDGHLWRERLRRRLAAAGRDPDEDTGCEIGVHLTYDAPMYYAAVSASIQDGAYNRPAPARGFHAGIDWPDRLRAFCELMDIPWRDPGWHLVNVMY